MNIKALADNVVVRLDKMEQKHGSIELPQNVKAQSDAYIFGTVVDVGPGREDTFMSFESGGKKAKVFCQTDLVVGERVILQPFAVSHKFKDAEGCELTVVSAYNILARIKE